jgi:hypothetical protein
MAEKTGAATTPPAVTPDRGSSIATSPAITGRRAGAKPTKLGTNRVWE